MEQETQMEEGIVVIEDEEINQATAWMAHEIDKLKICKINL